MSPPMSLLWSCLFILIAARTEITNKLDRIMDDNSSPRSASSSSSIGEAPSSPFEPPKSSPVRECASPTSSSRHSSPLYFVNDSTSSDDQINVYSPNKRKKYESNEPEAPPTSMYWHSEQPTASCSLDPAPLEGQSGIVDTAELQTEDTIAEEIIQEPREVNPVIETMENNNVIVTVHCSIPTLETDDVIAATAMETLRTAVNLIAAEDQQIIPHALEQQQAGTDKADDFPPTSSSSEEDSSSSSDEEEQQTQSSSSAPSSEESECEVYQSSDDETSPGEEKVFEGCSLTVDEAVLSLMDLFVERKLTKVTLGAQLQCLLKFLPRPNGMPRSLGSLMKYVENLSPLPAAKVHYYCSVCLFYLGEEEKNCHLCGSDFHKFYQLSIAHQIKNFFENHGLADYIDKYRAARSATFQPGFVSDLLDGSEFLKIPLVGIYDLLCMGHTDGVSISGSSNCSLWPLEHVICQVAPAFRYEFVIISGVWFDSCKPYMNTYMKPFADELKKLREHGVKWTHPVTKQEHISLVAVPCFCVDAPVRAQLQNILGPTGKCSCNVCEQKMLKLPEEPALPGKEKKRRRRVFTFQEEIHLRTGDRMMAQAEQTKNIQQRVNNADPVKGVKGISVMSKVPGCDVGTVVFPEYMHLLLCLIKHFFHLWFETDGPWSLKESRDKINSYLLHVRVPDFITRIPRSTDSYLQWKANELRTFVLYLSLPIFSECMKPEYFQHWLLFVYALHLLLQGSVSAANIERADIMLKMFLREFEKLYKAEHSTYYLHNVRHLALAVERYGPLWANSAFQLESFNGALRRFIHGTQNQAQELINNIQLALGVQILKARVADSDNRGSRNIGELRNRILPCSLSSGELQLLAPFELQKPISVFYRCVISRNVYTCYLYKRQKRRNNYTVCLLTSEGRKEFGEVKCYCQDAAGLKKIAIVKLFAVEHSRIICHDITSTVVEHIIPVRATNKFIAVPVQNFLFKTVSLGQYVCCRPNSYEVNL